MGLIKKYETGELIDTGSMGSVYRARDIVLERDVALKILHSRGDLDPELKERFYREARTGASLRHPNVVVVYELDEHNGVPFMAMELLTGADLRHYISERRSMSLAQKVELFAQICDGLGEAHRRGIVHRDIKPSNIFIQEDGTAKILDFGIARVSSSKLTIAGKVLGTPNYMAPEQINRRQCDSRSDLFSAAIVFFEFLVYSHPFQSSFIPRRIVEDDPDTLFDRDPLIPQALADLVYRALQKRPESRIQTAEEFAAGLRAVLQALRTGLSAEPVIQALSTVSLPDPTPATAGSPDSPDGRLAGFVQMLSDFEAAVRINDVLAARAIVADMARLESVDERFSEALRDCRVKLDQLQAAAQPATKVAAAGVGGSFSTPVIDRPSAGSEPVVSSPALKGSQPWDNGQSIFDDRTIKLGEDVLERWNPETPEALSLVCESCGARNRGTATYCHNCGKTIGGARAVQQTSQQPAAQAAAQVAAPVPKTFGQKSAEMCAAAALKARQGIDVVTESGRRAWSQFSAQPRNTQYALLGGLALCVVVAITALLVLGPMKPVPVLKAMGTARVQAYQTALIETEAPSSKQLMILPRGTGLNILSRVITPGQRLVRVQLGSPKPRPPGFVALADLAELSSSDPAVEWEYVGLRRPAPGASPEASRLFSRDLTTFAEGFSGTPQARLASLEQAQIHLAFAELAKAASKDRSEWQGDLDLAKKAIDTAGITEGSPDEEKKLLARYQDLSKKEEPEALSAEDMAKVGNWLKQAAAAWHGGDVDGCEAYAKKVLAIDRHNKEAAAWLWQVEESRKQ